MTPTIGRIVHYRLSADDATAINKRRSDAAANRRANPDEANGYVAHVGNSACAGQCCAAVVVQTFGGPNVNLQVLLDGADAYWATSRPEGDGEGQWTWPPRVDSTPAATPLADPAGTPVAPDATPASTPAE